jgi:hypothetical protein
MPMKLGDRGCVRLEIRELPRQRFRLTLELLIGDRVVRQIDRRDFDSEPQMWRAVADLAADKQAEFGLAQAEARRL